MGNKLLTGGRIIVVARDEEKRTRLVDIIQGFGFETRQFEDLSSARDICHEFQPDAVVFFAEKSGEFFFKSNEYVVCDRLEHPPSFLVINASESDRGKISDMEEGADEFLAWPVIPAELEHRLKAAVMLRRSLQENREHREFQEEALDILRWHNSEYSHELAEARTVQDALHRVERLALNGFVINSSIRAAQRLNGDFIDFIRLDQFRIAIVLMDVSGHGAAAAMIAGMLHAWLHSNFHDRVSLATLTGELNRYLVSYTPENMYATGFIGILDTLTGNLEYVLAGHHEPLFWKNGACIEGPVASTPVLGLHEDFRAVISRSHIAPADGLMIYSDGLLDAFAESGDPQKRVCGLYQRHNQGLCLRNRRCGMVDDILQGGNEPGDDMSMICIKRFPNPLFVGSLKISIPETGRYEFQLSSSEEAMIDLYSFMVDHLREETGEEFFWDLLQVTMELVKNAIKWGNGRDQAKHILCTVRLDDREIKLTVEDEGAGFDTAPVLERGRKIDPKQLPADDTRPGGLGIPLALGLADQLSFNKKGNRVTAVFVRKSSRNKMLPG